MQTETQATETQQTAQTDAGTTTTEEAQASAATTTEATGTDTTTETQGDEGEQQQEQERNEKGQFKPSVQKRIDNLTFQRHQAEREAAHWKAIAESRAQAAAPKPSDYASDEEYNAAMLDHRIEDGVNRGLAKTAQAQADKFSQEATSAAGEAYNQRVTDAVSRIPDFADVVGKADIAISPALQEALRDSERGPDLVYYLAKNPAEAERLNAMSVRQMDREIGRMEHTIGTPAKPSPPAARTTSAPPPVKPGTPASAPASNDPEKMSPAEFAAWAKANGSKYIR